MNKQTSRPHDSASPPSPGPENQQHDGGTPPQGPEQVAPPAEPDSPEAEAKAQAVESKSETPEPVKISPEEARAIALKEWEEQVGSSIPDVLHQLNLTHPLLGRQPDAWVYVTVPKYAVDSATKIKQPSERAVQEHLQMGYIHVPKDHPSASAALPDECVMRIPAHILDKRHDEGVEKLMDVMTQAAQNETPDAKVKVGLGEERPIVDMLPDITELPSKDLGTLTDEDIAVLAEG